MVRGLPERTLVSEGQSRGLELTVLMPCLNEAETLSVCIQKAQSFLDQAEVAGEILVADNGSTDGSLEIAADNGARVVRVEQRGYGSALRAGARMAKGRFIIMADADDSYDFTALGPLLEELRGGCDLVMGNRFQGGIEPGAMPLKNRYLGNPVLTGLGRLFFRSPVGDFHCGLRGFTSEAFERMALRTTGMEFASEMVIKATMLKMSIAEVPVKLYPDGRGRAPHLRPWADGWRHLRFMLLYSPRWLFLYPGAFMTLAGLLIVGLLTPNRLLLGSVVLDVHTLVYGMVFLLVGVQTLTFAIIASVYTTSRGLVPETSLSRRASSNFSLELGVAAGVILCCLGLVAGLAAVWVWAQTSFGPLKPGETLRLVIPSALGFTVGGQLILSSFMLSILSLRTSTNDPEVKET